MAAERKLKAEIDRNLKKVQEGQEIFEDLWNQVHDTENANQREKLEGELKKEIKKLQRLREQIKAWIAGADIKDKQPLMDARKSIERDMERFKACEKEAKLKGAFAGADKKDPKERAKEEARDWINNTVESLEAKVEEHEYEMEELSASVKKKQKPPPRLTELEEIVARHKDHIDKLEKVLRCLDNDTISPDELEDLKNDMELYLSGGDDAEESGIDFTDVDGMYANLLDRLDAVDLAVPVAVLLHAKNKGKEKDEDKEREKERERERAAAAAAKAQLIAQGNSTLKLEEDERKPARPAPPAPAALPTISAPTPQPPPPARPVPPPLKEAPSVEPPEPSPVATPRSQVPPSPGAVGADSSGRSLASSLSPAPSGSLPTPAAAPVSAWSKGTGSHASGDSLASILQAAAAPAPAGASAAGAKAAVPFAQKVAQGATAVQPPTASQQAAPSAAAPAVAKAQPAAPAAKDAAAVAPPPANKYPAPLNFILNKNAEAQQQAAAAAQQKAQQSAPAPTTITAQPAEPSGRMDADKQVPPPAPAGAAAVVQQDNAIAAEQLAALAKTLSLESDREAAMRAAAAGAGPPLPDIVLQPVAPVYSTAANKLILDACYSNSLPQLSDTEWKKTKPRHPVQTPASYPRTIPEVVDNPALFRKLDPECLFFAFYFQPETYQQYLAALELKRQSWRFHKHHNAWFQRFTEPTVTSDEYEQGAYVYFDYNIVHDDLQTGWCYRRKENFTFRYDALEDELRVQPGP